MIRIPTTALCVMMLYTGGCASFTPATDEIETAATVRFVDVEGGCWRLDGDNGTRYEPVGLPHAFRQDGRRVVVTLEFPGNLGSFCQVGQLAQVAAIRNQ